MKVSCVPQNDEREHELAPSCWCNPDVDWLDPETGRSWPNGGPRIVHIAADCREFAEQVTGESLEPGKGWVVIEHD